MKVLITGGNGYIASSLKSKLSDSYSVTSVTRADFDFSNSDKVSGWFADKQFDVVIHTAIVGGSRLKAETHSVIDQNLMMHYNLVANREKFGRLITFGSGAEIFSPDTPYGMSKKIISDSIKTIDNWYNLRIFAVFDHEELSTRFIKSNIMRYISRQPMIIHSNRLMDFFYMDDLVTLVHHYIETSSPNKEVNCSYREKHTLVNIANHINKLSDYRVPVIVEDREKFGVYCADGESLPIHTVGLLEGIRRTYNALIDT